MANTFFTEADFLKNFGKEMTSAVDVYNLRSKNGSSEHSLATYDFVFVSDSEDKLIRLGNFLSENYNYNIKNIIKADSFWELSGDATEFPVNENNLMYWSLDLYRKGYEFDCTLDGYGALGDLNERFPDIVNISADQYFEMAVDAHDKRNYGMAVIHFSTALKINPKDPDIWYSRAIVKDEIGTWKSARADYDKAIELAPDFVDAIVNRGTNKDEAGEYDEAIKDYDKAIQLDPINELAFFNRGNTKLHKKDYKSACEDWKRAKELGADYAEEQLIKYCTP